MTNFTTLPRYEGGLTTPPYSEIVVWTVFEEPQQLSRNQLRRLRRIKDKSGKIIQDNYRTVQNPGGRIILKSIALEPLAESESDTTTNWKWRFVQEILSQSYLSHRTALSVVTTLWSQSWTCQKFDGNFPSRNWCIINTLPENWHSRFDFKFNYTTCVASTTVSSSVTKTITHFKYWNIHQDTNKTKAASW